MTDNKKSTMKIKNKIFAIEAAPAAIPPNPNTAAMIATTRKVTVQRNITFNLIGYRCYFVSTPYYIKYRAIHKIIDKPIALER